LGISNIIEKKQIAMFEMFDVRFRRRLFALGDEHVRGSIEAIGGDHLREHW
jgi:hypothetical protein